MSLGIQGSRQTAPPMLICLDPREPVTAQDSESQASWRRGARRLLLHARACGWPVGHLLVSHPPAQAARWRAISGLSPQPMEPVFYHEPDNPCGNVAFLRFTQHHGRAELMLIGNSIGASALSVALSLSVRGCALAIARDAIATSEHEWRGLKALAGLTPEAPAASVRLEPVSRLVAAAPELRLIVGGRS